MHVHGTPGNDTLSLTASGGIFSYGGNDTLNVTATRYFTQIHTYASDGDDVTNFGFSGIRPRWQEGELVTYSFGHHSRGGLGADVFNFTNLNQFSTVAGQTATIVGRIEDYNHSEDTIQINGSAINLNNLPSNVRLVAHNGDADDANTYAQQWLLIDTGAGHIFYALEGARVDMDGMGGANSNDQEAHFIHDIPNLNTLQDVAFIDQKNYVPAGFAAGAGGVLINDDDKNAADVNAQINGTAYVDMIAAGLNDDTVRAGSGNDRVWGGSGHDRVFGDDGDDRLEGNTGNDYVYGGNGNDFAYGGHGNDRVYGQNGNDRVYGDDGSDYVYGQDGNDRVYGGTGNDYLYGGNGVDRLYGQNGNDYLRGDNGNDFLYGHSGNDRMFGRNDNDYLSGSSGNDQLFGENGEDRLYGGSGNDYLRGGAGRDTANGGSGSDRFDFRTGDLVYWSQTSGANSAERSLDLDLIESFAIGQDRMDFRNFSGVDSRADLKSWKTTIDGDVHFTVQVRATNERILVDVEDTVEWNQFFVDSNFYF
jgi:Ca2+-binding RTX toxin-like protein